MNPRLKMHRTARKITVDAWVSLSKNSNKAPKTCHSRKKLVRNLNVSIKQ